jgi:ribosomal protein L24E/energy-coupling factor transporter ATP-binding protein EcfA2
MDQPEELSGNMLHELNEGAANDFAFLIPNEKFVYRINGIWNAHESVGKEGIINHLIERGMDADMASDVVKSRLYTKAYGVDIYPGEGDIYVAPDGRRYLNTWRKPTIQRRPGEYPTIDRLIQWTTQGDDGAQTWLLHWMAAKVQQPALAPKVAVVVTGEQGSGKGTLALLMRTMLGPDNCATIGRDSLESQFNARWIGKLFVLADEIISSDNTKSISDQLKVLIDGAEVEHQGKNKDQRAVKNRIAWMFASNDKVSPVILEAGDRRYTVLSNHTPVPQDYKNMLDSSFEADRQTPTSTFMAEIEGFYDDLLSLEVDRELITRPYENDARSSLIEAALPAHELFIRAVEEGELEELLEVVCNRNFDMQRTRTEWDLGDEGISTQALYLAYVEFTKRVGMKALKLNKFGGALKNRPKPWPHGRPSSPSGRRVNVYLVPRKGLTTTPVVE